MPPPASTAGWPWLAIECSWRPHAHLVALDRFTGKPLWDTTMADWRENYGATSAPLVVGDLVVSGTSGGDEGIRGFVAAFDQATGREVWRFWTVPRPGEPGADTWRGTAIDHPCAATWLTGTYDPALDIVYWPTGNPCPDYDGPNGWVTTLLDASSRWMPGAAA